MNSKSVQDLIDGFASRRANLNSAKEALREEIASSIKAAVPNVFDKLPSLESISWNQYTPYFNDGDSCVFGVGEFGAKFSDPAMLRESLLDERLKTWDGKIKTDDDLLQGRYDDDSGWGLRDFKDNEVKSTLKQIFNLLDCLEQDDFEKLWGDHTTVTISAEGISTDEYDHD